jgi:uncharacterized protein YjbI with pentapeptide repeats
MRGAILSDEAELIEANMRRVILSEADLIEANMSEAYMIGADLSEANLIGADLSDAVLDNANLSGAEGISNEELAQQSTFLEGATMPNGQKYEDWLKSKDRESDG